ncbi:TPA_asm: hypothetical protein G3458_001868, partial [Salmonella enterica subsp. enterica serovar Infantis]|nr:hypothetical protein [Salmonella enterica subsp. enterica serovar Infantis]
DNPGYCSTFMNFGWIMMCRGESARGDKRHFSVRYALLFFERDTKSLSH